MKKNEKLENQYKDIKKLEIVQPRMRLCGVNWEYCDGKCENCRKGKITYANRL